MEKKTPRSVGTHAGRFHADEVTACAFLIIFDLVDKDKIYRTRDSKILSTCEFLCDLGGEYDPSKKIFDHHQASYRGELSSAGMILKYLLDIKKIDLEEYNFFNDTLVRGVDANDNGKDECPVGHCTFSDIIDNFNPAVYEVAAAEENMAFSEALEFVLDYLKKSISHFNYIRDFRPEVKDAMERYSDCLMFDEAGPWLENFFALGGEKHLAKFVIMPAGEHWKLRGVPPSKKEWMHVRISQPKEWLGLMGDELREKSHIPGAIFCHKGGFISIWKTKEDAFQALEYIKETT